MEIVATRNGECTVLAGMEKNRSESVRVSVSERHERILVDLRVWFWGDDELHPTKRGVTFQARHVPALLKMLREAADELGVEVADDPEEWEERARRVLPNRYDPHRRHGGDRG
jgi:hypothetical protein